MPLQGGGLWSAKCLTKCSVPSSAHQGRSELGCDVYSLGRLERNVFVPAKPLPTTADAFPLLDHGKVAGSAQLVRDVAKNRTLMWQVVGEGDGLNGQRNCSGPRPHRLRSWEGVQTMPRVVWPSAACAASPAAEDCVLLVRCAPEIDELITWRKAVRVPSDGSTTSLSIAAAQSPNNLKIHARLPVGYAGSKDAELRLEAFAGGPAVTSALRNHTLTVGPAWRADLRHLPTPQIRENISCTFPSLAEHHVIEAFLDGSVLEVFSDSGRCAIITRVYMDHSDHSGAAGSGDARTITLRAAAGVELGAYGMRAAYEGWHPQRRAQEVDDGDDGAAAALAAPRANEGPS